MAEFKKLLPSLLDKNDLSREFDCSTQIVFQKGFLHKLQIKNYLGLDFTCDEPLGVS